MIKESNQFPVTMVRSVSSGYVDYICYYRVLLCTSRKQSCKRKINDPNVSGKKESRWLIRPAEQSFVE